jgi:hypothetical protein
MSSELEQRVREARAAIVALADAGVPNEHIASLSTTLDRGAEAARKRAHLTVIKGTADARPSDRYIADDGDDSPKAG